MSGGGETGAAAQWEQMLAAAEQFAAVAYDLIQEARSDGTISPIHNVGTGDTLHTAVDGVRLLLLATPADAACKNADARLLGSVVKWLQDVHGYDLDDGLREPGA